MSDRNVGGVGQSRRRQQSQSSRGQGNHSSRKCQNVRPKRKLENPGTIKPRQSRGDSFTQRNTQPPQSNTLPSQNNPPSTDKGAPSKPAKGSERPDAVERPKPGGPNNNPETVSFQPSQQGSASPNIMEGFNDTARAMFDDPYSALQGFNQEDSQAIVNKWGEKFQENIPEQYHGQEFHNVPSSILEDTMKSSAIEALREGVMENPIGMLGGVGRNIGPLMSGIQAEIADRRAPQNDLYNLLD